MPIVKTLSRITVWQALKAVVITQVALAVLSFLVANFTYIGRSDADVVAGIIIMSLGLFLLLAFLVLLMCHIAGSMRSWNSKILLLVTVPACAAAAFVYITIAGLLMAPF